ncbi:hypothetical protein MC7420_511 [Coleofasciculus chthonoplastes PCC 7420]|uniref:Uncharacterized protein n=1 Tax=Coleofasciculus chthonoplastes PCC 7420 TaxID=118168 RepID=B4VLW1_9CYAN|nr:hypothetical protein [Coleofasciculus chthonoplastes]EDX77374.1 hypothetical protein MC7420_511 [Coleofasciculus chthonoplastes PCC 7420]
MLHRNFEFPKNNPVPLIGEDGIFDEGVISYQLSVISYQLSGEEEDGGNCVGAGFTTIFAVTPRCN